MLYNVIEKLIELWAKVTRYFTHAGENSAQSSLARSSKLAGLFFNDFLVNQSYLYTHLQQRKAGKPLPIIKLSSTPSIIGNVKDTGLSDEPSLVASDSIPTNVPRAVWQVFSRAVQTVLHELSICFSFLSPIRS